MAHAVASRVYVINSVCLTLSSEEAEFLGDILGCIGGSPDSSRRRLSDEIRNALRKAGVKFYNVPPDFYGTITFEDRR